MDQRNRHCSSLVSCLRSSRRNTVFHPKGTLLLSGVGTIGVPYIVGDEEVYFKDANIIWLRPKDTINVNFVSVQLESPPCVTQILDGSMGATVRTLTISRANAIFIKVPPVDEQERVVNELTSLDEMKRGLETKYQSELDNLEELRQSILEQAFEGKLTKTVAA